MIFTSLKYRAFLHRILEDASSYYLIAKEDGLIVGALPIFVRRHALLGGVANSLPFFGSNGGLLLAPGQDENGPVAERLLQAWADFSRDNHIVASTLISSPLEPRDETYQRLISPDFIDYRIGQITHLPLAAAVHEKDLESVLMATFHYKTRNSVRKGQKSNIRISDGAAPSAMKDLWEIHRENMSAINGQAKPLRIFEAIEQTFSYGTDYKIYRAERDGRLIASLLVLFFNKTAEYFTPCTVSEFREYQPMSLLIFEAMLDVARRGFYYWNWGGTWASQTGVYQFKKRWGTEDLEYRYYTKVLDRKILACSKSALLEYFPYFYVAPFEKLESLV